ncbi:unnamed protein product [Cylindrotheca closterium]|uniref:Uncharacterized protein n=1 Tax=Cylindrotheca closterium TaxID=2856 RepID=A0AAD2CKF3_9STRA|nr:unnamed protein product [Cylindrotheca closterium]
MKVTFSIRENEETVPTDLRDPPVVLYGPHHQWKGLLDTHPVDLLVIEKGHYTRPSGGPKQEPWEDMVDSVPPKHRPKVIIESWRSDPTLWQYGPTSKPTTTRWREAGCNINCCTIKATSIGGAITQERLLVVRTRIDCQAQWTWDSLDRDMSVIRPMGNLLTPPGLIPRKSYSQSGSTHTPHSLHDPMPNQIGAWIQTEKGVPRLLKEEVARGLGIPKGYEAEVSHKSLQRTSPLFHWEYISFSLQHLFNHPTATPTRTTQGPKTGNNLSRATTPLNNNVFDWHPPDLSLPV